MLVASIAAPSQLPFLTDSHRKKLQSRLWQGGGTVSDEPEGRAQRRRGARRVLARRTVASIGVGRRVGGTVRRAATRATVALRRAAP